MRTAPPLLTERLVLRSLTLEDAPDVQRLAGDRDIALMTVAISHPYEDGMAEEWIRSCSEEYEKDAALNFAITLKADKNLIGAIGIGLEREHQRGETRLLDRQTLLELWLCYRGGKGCCRV